MCVLRVVAEQQFVVKNVLWVGWSDSVSVRVKAEAEVGFRFLRNVPEMSVHRDAHKAVLSRLKFQCMSIPSCLGIDSHRGSLLSLIK